jgi:AraC-like DNA-binding protein
MEFAERRGMYQALLVSDKEGVMTRNYENLFVYLMNEGKKISSGIGTRNKDIAGEFVYVAKFAEMLLGSDNALLYPATNGLYDAVISEIFRQYSWLDLYFSDMYHENNVLLDTYENFVGEYRDKITSLLEAVDELFPPRMPMILSDICNFILSNPESDVSLHHITGKFFINYTYLSNLFRIKAGRRFNEYILRVKMQRACHLLRRSGLKVSEISSNLGYKDTEYFSRLFRNFSGKTPTSYRKNMIARIYL